MKFLVWIGIFTFLLYFLIFTRAEVAVSNIKVEANPIDQPPRICLVDRDIIIGWHARSGGINALDYRTGSYIFTGEQLQYTIIVRDPNGALDIGDARISVSGNPESICTEIQLPPSCGHLGSTNPLMDKAYKCYLTVESLWTGEKKVKITVYNSAFQPTDGTHVETWYFNPALSLQVSTSDGQPIRFENMPYMADTPEERTVHSLNRLVIKNNSTAGVNMWVFIAGTDFYSPSGAARCPTSNVMSIRNMKYRAWTGTQWTSWEGWTTMEKYDQNAQCDIVYPPATTTSSTSTTVVTTTIFHTTTTEYPIIRDPCHGALPVPYPNTSDNIPDMLENILSNQGKIEVEFKLTYPMPCVGSFREGSIIVFGKAV